MMRLYKHTGSLRLPGLKSTSRAICVTLLAVCHVWLMSQIQTSAWLSKLHMLELRLYHQAEPASPWSQFKKQLLYPCLLLDHDMADHRRSCPTKRFSLCCNSSSTCSIFKRLLSPIPASMLEPFGRCGATPFYNVAVSWDGACSNIF